MALLDAQTLSVLANRPALADPGTYDPAYIDGVIADVSSQISQFLLFDPVLQVVTDEEVWVELDGTGYFQPRYRMQTKVAPFVPGPASTIFSSMVLNYAYLTPGTTPINLAYVSVEHKYGRAYLAPGAISALVSVSFDLGGPYGTFRASSALVSYVAGYATGINDPLGPGNVSYGARPMPADITQAAVLLCKERISLDDASNLQTTNASAGSISYIRTQTQEVKYQSFSQTTTVGQTGALGAGTSLSMAAAKRLAKWQRTEIA